MVTKEHVACPDCGSVCVRRTTMYFRGTDRNLARCESCDWKGIVDDLVGDTRTNDQKQIDNEDDD